MPIATPTPIFPGRGWFHDVLTCYLRSNTEYGSSHYMNKYWNYFGILSDEPSMNPSALSSHQIYRLKAKQSELTSFLIRIVKNSIANMHQLVAAIEDGSFP
ncbi:uncharacterized protein M6B38_361595 [Iris pallida]|uniref:Pectin acetylesterase n=1 Tax=Iris pallida TaxID=29817 RepID=A0AAX6GKP5_IRIPA|nr:uncharacterized protein M6B38_361595 [Iris pallida]